MRSGLGCLGLAGLHNSCVTAGQAIYHKLNY